MATWPSSLGNPQFSGYDLETTDPTIRTDMEGGSARVRRRYTAAPDTVSLKFIFDQAQMATFRAFWDYDLMNGAAWAYMPVKTGRVSGMEAKECRPIAGKFKAVPAGSRHWYVEFQVEVRRGVYLWYDTINAMKLPSLELDFGGTKSLNSVLTTSAQPSVSVEFSRASEGTYYGADGLLKTAQANEARFDFDPITLACKGLLIEESRTNLLTYSEQFDNAAWVKTGLTVTPNALASPDGSITADKISETTDSRYCYRGTAVTSGVVYAASYFVKAAERTQCRIQFYTTNGAFSNSSVTFDLSGGVVVGQPGSGILAYGIVPLKNGWFRVWATCTALATVTGNVSITISGTYTGDGVSGLYVWGAQLEAGDFPTSYIQTTSAAATRSSDIAQMTGANFSSWYRQDEGTFVASVIRGNLTNYGYLFAVDAGSSAESIRVFFNPDGSARFSINDDDTTAASISPGALPLGSHKVACAYQENNSAATWNGTNAKVDSLCSIPTPYALRIGISGGSSYYLNGHIARLTYYPKRLSNAELQALSA